MGIEPKSCKAESIKTFLLDKIDKIKILFKKLFVAEDNEPKMVRTKHLRFGILLAVIFVSICMFVIEFTTKSSKHSNSASVTQMQTSQQSQQQANGSLGASQSYGDKQAIGSGIKDLASGVTNEKVWTEIRGKEVDEIKNKQLESDSKQQALEDKVVKDKISRDEVADMMATLRAEVQSAYDQKLLDEINKLRAENEQKVVESALESKVVRPKKKTRKIGDYIPANSYAQAKLISGVDAGVGVSSEANPRQALLRITGETISAGIGAEYLKTKRLVGCLLSAKAIGDISSEKAYLDGVLMTCAVDKHTAIEVPVKAYITSNAKSGIRGEVVSREGDMVLKSFLSGLAGGFGNGISQMSQPQMSLANNGIVSDLHRSRDILRGGLGAGAASSGDTLSQYFIKRAEQYQPVISINEGIEVYVVFQEGFSLKDDEDENGKN